MYLLCHFCFLDKTSTIFKAQWHEMTGVIDPGKNEKEKERRKGKEKKTPKAWSISHPGLYFLKSFIPVD